MAGKLTVAEIDKLPLTEADKLRMKAYYGHVEDLGGDERPTTAATKAADAARYAAVEDLGGDDRPTTTATKAADAARAAGQMGLAPAYKIIQPKPVYVPVAPGTATIGKIAQPEPLTAQADGPALDVDSAGIGGRQVAAWAKKPVAVDYGSASVPYEVGELGGLGMTEPDRIVVKKPKEMVMEPDVVTASAPVPAKKYAAKGK